MSKTKKRAMIESDTDDSGSSEVEQVCGGGEEHTYAQNSGICDKLIHRFVWASHVRIRRRYNNKLCSQNVL